MMKQKKLVFLAASVLAAGIAIGKAPEIERSRIDTAVAEELERASFSHQGQLPDADKLRKSVTLQLQTVEILKNEALKLGLDKNPEVQARFKNAEAQFYATQYALHLEQETKVDEAEIRAAYDRQTRAVKIQQVNFASPEEVLHAQQLLLKGLSFDQLMQRYPSPDQVSGFISPDHLPPELAKVISQMSRGQVTREPVQLNGRFYLFKLAASERNPDAPPFEQVKDILIRQAKQYKMQQQIDELLQKHGMPKLGNL
ncbi:putative peptidyl-prolyl isomerasen [Neisseria zoodegmatis]|uniref:peptidylprolyl isomerase n=1 Tax=Neisseria zoodegmatis TaxID=326523 RepID=A0A378WH73_9NEIS|nr:peptidylprolyl isomerase [Neisseria zoodegmatis]SUA36750.1 putative peptidyl-prolyl isomerasen [Neisseria zoodegmatis]